jgi:hypothetical protein
VQYTTSGTVVPRRVETLGVGEGGGVAGVVVGVVRTVAFGAIVAVGIGVLQAVARDNADRRNKS